MARQLMGREYEVEFYVLLRQYGRELKVMKSNEYHLKVSICAYFAHLTSTGRRKHILFQGKTLQGKCTFQPDIVIPIVIKAATSHFSV